MTAARPLWLLVSCLPMLAGCPLERIHGSGASHDGASAASGDPLLAENLKGHVEKLAHEIGPRSFTTPTKLEEAAKYVRSELDTIAKSASLGRSVSHPYGIEREWARSIRTRAWGRGCGKAWREQWPVIERQASPFTNIELVLPGSDGAGTVVVGAHYDSDTCEANEGNPGADDNASGVAVLIELARLLAGRTRSQTIRLVAFTNEEEPFFHTQAMGSWRYAECLRCTEPRACVTGMLSLETLGYYRDEPDTQNYPPLVQRLLDLPSAGNFIAFVGNPASRALVHELLGAFQRATVFPAEGWVATSWVPGVDWSDHWSFWEHDWPAVMVTDTAPSRNRCYHRPCDVPARLDYARMAVVTVGLQHAVESLAAAPVRCAPAQRSCYRSERTCPSAGSTLPPTIAR